MEDTIGSIPITGVATSCLHISSIGPEYINLFGTIYPTAYNSVALAQIYKCPPPPTKKTSIAIVSFGGGLYGTIDSNGILTNGDCQAYWAWQGIASSNFPTVQVKFLNGATNTLSNAATDENTLDVEMIGSWYPSSNLTICLYITRLNTYQNIFDIFTQACTSTINVKGTNVLPSAVSVSWNYPELPAYTDLGMPAYLQLDTIFSNAAANGVNVCVAAGDHVATDGYSNLTLNWFSSSQWCISCGGTSLSSTNNIYDSNTVEIVWNNSNVPAYSTWGTGGGISPYYPKGSYQSVVTQYINTSNRCAPDIALSADTVRDNSVVTYQNGGYYFTGGTSVVAPCMSAFIAALNITYFFNNKSYKLNSNCFHDITVGNNRPLAYPSLGYDARVGYDLCTGLGSIMGTNISTAMNTYIPSSNLGVKSILSNYGYFSTDNVPFYSTLSNTKWYDSSGNLTTPPAPPNVPFSFFQNKMCRF